MEQNALDPNFLVSRMLQIEVLERKLFAYASLVFFF